jgi:hypothetical protein
LNKSAIIQQIHGVHWRIASLANRLEQITRVNEIRIGSTDSRLSLANCFTGKLFNRRIGYQWQTVRLLHWQIALNKSRE